MEKYDKLCDAPDCYNVVKEDDIERNFAGEICERSKICWDCRTPQDKRAIKDWRTKWRKRAALANLKELPPQTNY